MTSIEVSIDLSAGTAQVSGPISNADNVQIVLKDYAENVTDGSRVRIVRGCHVLITGGTVTVSGDNGVCLLNTNSDEVKKLAESMRCPSQVGVEIVVDDTEDESVKASGRALLLLNWVEVCGCGVGGGAVQDGAVPITNIDELPSRYRESDMRNKINEIARVISGRAVLLTAILAPFALFGVGVNVYTAQKDQVWNDERIVTNVTFDAEGLVTSLEAATNYVDSATNALSASLSEKISDSSESSTNYTDSAVADLDESFSNKIVESSSESKSYTDTATNALAAKIPVIDLDPYATRTWVETKGYVTSDALGGVATKDWVVEQGYLTQLAMAPYATIDWVLGKGYATASVTNGLASVAWTIQEITDEARRSDARGDAKFATKSELDAMKRMYADTNGVTRLWSEDGLTMTDGTGVVWNVTWNVVTNWTSLSNGVVFAQVKDQMGFDKWVSQGIYTNALGQSSSATINFEAGVLSIFLDAHAGSTGTFEVSPGQIIVDAHDYGYNDTFSNSTVRVPAFSFRSRVVTNAVGYVTGGGGGDYLPLTGGTLTGDLAIGTEAKIELNAPSDDNGAGVNIGAGSSGGGWFSVAGGPYSGGYVNIGGSTMNGLGGTLTVKGGVDGGGVIEAVGDDASIKKGGKEVATEEQLNAKADTTNVYTKAEVDAKVENSVLPTNTTFSNAVLAVGLNIDTNSVAVLNEIAETFGGFPIEGTATTVGGLLAALAAAIAWLKKNKSDKATTLAGYGITDAATMASIAPEYSPSSAYSVGAFVYHDGNIYQCTTAIADGGEAWSAAPWELRKLDDFFTESNSLLTATIDARLPYPINAVPSTGVLKDRTLNTTSLASVTVPDNFTDLIIRASVASSLSVTMPEAITTKYGDTFPGEAGEYLITITKTGASEAYVRTIKLEVANA